MSVKDNCIIVTYRIEAEAKDVETLAFNVAIEQTVELPDAVVTDPKIRDEIIGKILEITESPSAKNVWFADIQYTHKVIGDDLLQLYNVIFGNSSLQPGVSVWEIQWGKDILAMFKGPNYGQAGLRKLLNEPKEAMLCTALKPIGLNSDELADLAYLFAKGGVHIIKDDHGLSNQASSPFYERIDKCVAAIEKANKETGNNSLYCPNLTTSLDRIHDFAKYAKDAGVGAFMFSPTLGGWDTMRMLADTYQLPMFSHPAFSGPYVITPSTGFSYNVFYGHLQRLAGVDSVVYCNFGGRFGMTQEEAKMIIKGCSEPMDNIKPIFPCPGGGMKFSNVDTMKQVYGNDVIYLMGGGLYEQNLPLDESTKKLLSMLK